MRFTAIFAFLLALAACNRGAHSNEAIRQAVIDHLAKAQLNVGGMNVTVTSVKYDGNQADAVVSITPKQGDASQGMSMNYHLEQQGNAWAVVKRDGGGNPHGGSMPVAPAAPGAANPHGGAGAPTQMPSPSDLPPVKK